MLSAVGARGGGVLPRGGCESQKPDPVTTGIKNAEVSARQPESVPALPGYGRSKEALWTRAVNFLQTAPASDFPPGSQSTNERHASVWRLSRDGCHEHRRSRCSVSKRQPQPCCSGLQGQVGKEATRVHDKSTKPLNQHLEQLETDLDSCLFSGDV